MGERGSRVEVGVDRGRFGEDSMSALAHWSGRLATGQDERDDGEGRLAFSVRLYGRDLIKESSTFPSSSARHEYHSIIVCGQRLISLNALQQILIIVDPFRWTSKKIECPRPCLEKSTSMRNLALAFSLQATGQTKKETMDGAYIS